MICAQIKMEGGGSYTQSMADLGVLIDEIHEAADCGSIGRRWTIELVEMTEQDYKALPDFEGH